MFIMRQNSNSEAHLRLTPYSACLCRRHFLEQKLRFMCCSWNAQWRDISHNMIKPRIWDAVELKHEIDVIIYHLRHCSQCVLKKKKKSSSDPDTGFTDCLDSAGFSSSDKHRKCRLVSELQHLTAARPTKIKCISDKKEVSLNVSFTQILSLWHLLCFCFCKKTPVQCAKVFCKHVNLIVTPAKND